MAYFTADRELVDPDFQDGVVASKREDCILQTIIGRGKKPTDWEQKNQVEAFPEAYNARSAEGADHNEANFAEYKDFVLAHVCEVFDSKGYLVTRHRQMLPGHNEKSGETLTRKRMKDAQNLMLSIERAISSDQEAVAYGESHNPVTRGLLSWLKPLATRTDAGASTLHSVHTIPKELCPVAGLTTNVANLTEAAFKAELIKARKQRGTGNMSLVGLVGIDLKTVMSEWLSKATDVNLRRTQPADLKKITLICDDFNFDGVTCHVMYDGQIGADASTMAIGDASHYTGAFIDPKMWNIGTLEALRDFPLPDKGAGPRGYHTATLRLTCLNPMGQFAIRHQVSQL
jgi:hypothetical protein